MVKYKFEDYKGCKKQLDHGDRYIRVYYDRFEECSMVKRQCGSYDGTLPLVLCLECAAKYSFVW